MSKRPTPKRRSARSAAKGKDRPPLTAPKRGGREGNNRVPIQLTIEREEECWDLYKNGYSQQTIAAEIERRHPGHTFSQQSVSKALARVEERAMAVLDEKVERHKVRQLAQLDGIYSLAMESFHMSRLEQHEKTRKLEQGARAGRGVKTVATVVKSTKTPGDPRFLEKALEAKRDQRKVLGIDVFKFDGVVKTDRPFETMTPEELQTEIEQTDKAIKDELHKAKRKRS